MPIPFKPWIFFTLLFIPQLSQSANATHMRGGRYCEIIVAKSLTEFSVYNTWGLNHCPETTWNKITVDQVKKETGSTRIHLNGPRYWVIDGFKHTTLINPTTRVIAGLKLREAGILHLGLFSGLKKNKPYQPREVARKTTWIYLSGKPIYELIAPTGEVFVMQSYSIQDVPQTMQSLAQLGTKLSLPKGWTFKTGILKHTKTIQAINNMAVVIQDNFFNTYQKATQDFL